MSTLRSSLPSGSGSRSIGANDVKMLAERTPRALGGARRGECSGAGGGSIVGVAGNCSSSSHSTASMSTQPRSSIDCEHESKLQPLIDRSARIRTLRRR